MKEKIIQIFLFIFISFVVIASAEEFGYNNQELPQLEYQQSNVNNNTLNVNNSQYLNGYSSSYFVPYLGAAADVDLAGYRLDTAEAATLGLRGQSGLRNTFAIYDIVSDTWIIYGGIVNDEMTAGVWTNSILPLSDSSQLIGNESLYYAKIYADNIYSANVYSDYSWLKDMASGYSIGLVPSGVLTTVRKLYIDINDESRTLNIAGNTSLNQDVNTTSSPTFNNITSNNISFMQNSSAIIFASGEYIKGNENNIQFFGYNGSAGINNLVCNLTLNSAYYADFGCWNQSYSARTIRFISSTLTSNDIYQVFGTSSSGYLGWGTTGNDHFKWSVTHGSATAGGFIEILDSLNIGNDYSFPIQYHPTLSIRSNRSATGTFKSTTDSLNFQHNITAGKIWTQNGSIYLIAGDNDFVILNGTMKTNLTGAGNGYACVDTNGILYRSGSACV